MIPIMLPYSHTPLLPYSATLYNNLSSSSSVDIKTLGTPSEPLPLATSLTLRATGLRGFSVSLYL